MSHRNFCRWKSSQIKQIQNGSPEFHVWKVKTNKQTNKRLQKDFLFWSAVAQQVEQVGEWSEGRWFKSQLQAGVAEQDTEPQTAPDVQLAPCVAAPATRERPAMSCGYRRWHFLFPPFVKFFRFYLSFVCLFVFLCVKSSSCRRRKYSPKNVFFSWISPIKKAMKWIIRKKKSIFFICEHFSFFTVIVY